MALNPSERLVRHRGDHTAKLESARRDRFFIAKICYYLWHVDSVCIRPSEVKCVVRQRNSAALLATWLTGGDGRPNEE